MLGGVVAAGAVLIGLLGLASRRRPELTRARAVVEARALAYGGRTIEEVSVPAPRRGFLKALATLPILPGTLGPQAPPAPPTQGARASGPDPVAEALAEAVRRQFGAHLDAGELEEVRKELERNRAAASRLRAAARLANADEPVGRFEARPLARRQP
jgi:hypothetical protein